MLYDLATEPPEPGTLLESVFLLVSLRRREAELLQTEAIVTAVASAPSGQIDLIRSALKEYKNSVFPFLEAERKKLYSQLRRGMEKTKQAEELRRQKRHTKI
jgi:ACT domain-containing protein